MQYIPFEKIGAILKIAHPYLVAPWLYAHYDTNFPGFKAKAVIDWISIQVTLARTTHFWNIQDQLRQMLGQAAGEKSIGVVAQDASMPNDPSTVFDITLQERQHENNAAKIVYMLNKLEAIYGFAAPAKTIGIEVSFDLKPIATANEREAAFAVYEAASALKYCCGVYGEDMRQVLLDGSVHFFDVRPEVDFNSTLYIGRQKYLFGKKRTSISWRIYPKVTDDNGKLISHEEYRARAEVTLQDEALSVHGLISPLALASYDFSSLADLLHFQVFKSEDAIRKERLKRYEEDMRSAVAKLCSFEARITGRVMTKKAKKELSELEAAAKQKTWLVNFGDGLLAGRASLMRNTEVVAEWQFGWDGTKKRLQHSRDTTPDKQLNRKVKAALVGLSTCMAEGVYPSISKKRARASKLSKVQSDE